MNQGPNQNEEKPTFIETIHEHDVRKTYKWILWIGVIFSFLLIIVVLFVSRFLCLQVIANMMFVMSVVVAIYFGFFTISAYYIARKVEEYVRRPIRSYEEFIEQVLKLLTNDRGPFKIMVYCADFALDRRVALKGGIQINAKMRIFVSEQRKDVFMLLPSKTERLKFLKDFLSLSDSEQTFDTGRIKEMIENEESHLRAILYSKLPCREYRGRRLPFQIFLSSETLVWIAVREPYPSVALRCSGFESKDENIRTTFEKIFQNYFDDAKEVDPVNN